MSRCTETSASYGINRPFFFSPMNAMNGLFELRTQAFRANVTRLECNIPQTRESVSLYRPLLRSCMRNKILVSANDKYFV